MRLISYSVCYAAYIIQLSAANKTESNFLSLKDLEPCNNECLDISQNYKANSKTFGHYYEYRHYSFPAGVSWLRIDQDNICPALLVAEDKAIVAASCVLKSAKYKNKNKKIAIDNEYMQNIRFEIGLEYAVLRSPLTDFIVHRKFVEQQPGYQNFDLMLTFLKYKLGNITSYTPLKDIEPARRKKLNAIGVFQSETQGDILTNVPGYGIGCCRVTKSEQHNCAEGKGFAGGPLFLNNGAVIGFNTGRGKTIPARAALKLLQYASFIEPQPATEDLTAQHLERADLWPKPRFRGVC